MKKLLLLILTALAAMFLLASCGDEPDDPPAGDTKYNITFKIGTKSYVKEVTENEKPSVALLTKREIGDNVVALWDKEFEPATEDATYTALIYTDESRVSATLLLDAYRTQPFTGELYAYDEKTGDLLYVDYQQDMNTSTAFFTLALEEYSDPKGGVLVDRIMDHLVALCYEGHEPPIDAWPTWSQMIYPAAITLACKTETVTDRFVGDYADMKERLDCLMRCFVILSTISSADWNDYQTGPGLIGNYYKSWNPNYVFANAMPIVNTVDYFGGADEVNGIIEAFDYDDYLADFDKYGFDTLKFIWTGMGQYESIVRTFMNEGGKVQNLNAKYYSGNVTESGNYSGVHWPVGYTEFVYTNKNLSGITMTLEDYVDMANNIMLFNFSGGAVVSGVADGTGTLIAYTLVDGEKNPMLGQIGMMLELSSTDRSSYKYCKEDFVCTAVELAFLDALGLIDEDSYSDLYSLAKVGMNDFLYKGRKGYHSYAWSGTSNDSDKNVDDGFGWARSMWLRIFDDTMLEYYTDKDDV